MKLNFFISGENHQTEVRHLHDPRRRNFQRNGTDVFMLTTSEHLGELVYIHIWHDDSAGNWFLGSVDFNLDVHLEGGGFVPYPQNEKCLCTGHLPQIFLIKVLNNL